MTNSGGLARLAGGAAAVLLALAGSACGSDSGNTGSGANTTGTSPSTSSTEASGEAVAWADKVCKSVESEVGTLTQKPRIDTSTPESAKAGLVTFLDNFGTALDRLIGGIKGAGAPPVPNGTQAVEETTKGLELAKKTVQDAQTKLSQTPMTDPAAAKQAFTEVASQLSTLGQVDATQALEDLPQLEDAFKKAPTCQKLDKQKTGSSPPTS